MLRLEDFRLPDYGSQKYIKATPRLTFPDHFLTNPLSKTYNSSQTSTMLSGSSLIALVAFLGTAYVDAAGYVLPSSGTASTTQFYLGPELASGTACGVSALPNGKSTSGEQGGGPGYLYVCTSSISLFKHQH